MAVEIGEIPVRLPADEARVVSPKFSYQGLAAGRGQPALHRRTDHPDHQRIRQVSQDTAQDVERARELGLVLRERLGRAGRRGL